MRRLELVPVAVHCPHFQRMVTATRNAAIDKIVACAESESCRDPAPAPGTAAEPHSRPFPRGCPVFPTLAK